MEKEKIDRINHLARKHREQGLSDEDKAEQQALRDEYRQHMKSQITGQLDRVYYKMPDGSVVKAVKPANSDEKENSK